MDGATDRDTGKALLFMTRKAEPNVIYTLPHFSPHFTNKTTAVASMNYTERLSPNYLINIKIEYNGIRFNPILNPTNKEDI